MTLTGCHGRSRDDAANDTGFSLHAVSAEVEEVEVLLRSSTGNKTAEDEVLQLSVLPLFECFYRLFPEQLWRVQAYLLLL